MRRARIHIYLGTALLPKRELDDQETAHDIIDVDIGEGEKVMQLDLEPQRATYIRRMETTEETQRRLEMMSDGRALVEQIGGVYTGDTSPKPKMVNERVNKNMQAYRYRIVTLEHVDLVGIEPGGGEIVDAQVIDGPASQ